MYQRCCNKCGSIDLYIKEKGNQTGLYCSDCGAWVKWLSKDEKRAFEHSKENEKNLNNNCQNVGDCEMDENELKKVLDELKSCTHQAEHDIADDIIADFIEKIGYKQIADAYRNVPKWFS